MAFEKEIFDSKKFNNEDNCQLYIFLLLEKEIQRNVLNNAFQSLFVNQPNIVSLELSRCNFQKEEFLHFAIIDDETIKKTEKLSLEYRSTSLVLFFDSLSRRHVRH